MQCIGKREHCSLFPMHCIRKKGDDNMANRETWYGYKENQCVISRTARDAKDDLDPTEVANKVQAVKDAFQEALDGIADKLIGWAPDSEAALLVQGCSMSPYFEEVANMLKNDCGSVVDGLDEVTGLAEKAYNEIQAAHNKAAYNECASVTSDVRAG